MSKQSVHLSREIHRKTTKDLIDLIEANSNLAEKSKKAEEWSAKISDATITFTFLYEYVMMILTFDDNTVLRFEGSAPGIGLGGTGGGSGDATFNVPPQTLLSEGKVSFRAETIAVVGGGIKITWYEHKTFGVGAYLGSGIAIGLGVGAGIPLGGSGQFTSA